VQLAPRRGPAQRPVEEDGLLAGSGQEQAEGLAVQLAQDGGGGVVEVEFAQGEVEIGQGEHCGAGARVEDRPLAAADEGVTVQTGGVDGADHARGGPLAGERHAPHQRLELVARHLDEHALFGARQLGRDARRGDQNAAQRQRVSRGERARAGGAGEQREGGKQGGERHQA
jgi:hypothetical protein